MLRAGYGSGTVDPQFNRIMNQAAALGKGAALYTVQFEAMTTQTAAQLQATAKELGVQYKSDWVKG